MTRIQSRGTPTNGIIFISTPRRMPRLRHGLPFKSWLRRIRRWRAHRNSSAVTKAFTRELADCPSALISGNKMCDVRRLAQQMKDALLQDAIRVGDALMLPQVFHPRFQEERFDQA